MRAVRGDRRMPTTPDTLASAPTEAPATPAVAPALSVSDALAYDRTHLANERTFAAWLRTGLSVAAGGIAVAHLVPEPSRDSLASLALGAAFVLVGVGVMAYGARQFARLAHDLARGGVRDARATPRAVYVLTAVIGALLLAVLVFLWTHQGRPRPGAAGRGLGSVREVRSAQVRPLLARGRLGRLSDTRRTSRTRRQCLT